jgi:hypothetical protein
MPASVAAASPAAVLPHFLAIAFERSQEWAAEENLYRDGSVQQRSLAETSRKRWVIHARLTATQLGALRAFYVARNGPQQEFYFYDPWETSPALSAAGYDESGSVTAGRYVVRFEGGWRESLQLGRGEAQVALVEVG